MILINEIIFIMYLLLIISTLLTALRLGPEALCSIVSIFWILANLFVTKVITLFGLHATASDALAVGATLGLNLIYEYYGKQTARKSIWISFLALIFYTGASLLQIMYVPSGSDIMHIHFLALLSPMPRILAASLIVFLVVQYLDYWTYSILLRAFNGRCFVLRNYISVSFTQLIDTVLFSFLALYGTVESIGQIILVSYLIKLATIALSTPVLALSRSCIKRQA